MKQIELEDKKEVVILIHGTGDGDIKETPEGETTEISEGERWWQKGSIPWRTLENQLPAHVELGEVFHWGKGPNSHRARVEAANKLLACLKKLERRGQGYHLVGHSHGGTVIWECLRLATYLKNTKQKPDDRKIFALNNLKSWTTVGTPFIDFAPKDIFGKFKFGRDHKGLYYKYFVRPGLWFFKFTGYYFAFFLIVVSIGCIATIFLSLISLVFDFGFELQGFWGFVLGIVGLILWNVLTVLYFKFYADVIEFSHAKYERWMARDTMNLFEEKWLGIYSSEDEAISLLKSSIDLELDVVNKRSSNKTFITDKAFFGVFWFRDRVFNLIFPKFTNQFVSRIVSNSILGSDRPRVAPWTVKEYPGKAEVFNVPLLESVDQKIIKTANDKAAKLIPEIRSLLYNFFHSDFDKSIFQKNDPFKGLVHNSYFEVQDVLDLIVHHISLSSVKEDPQTLNLDISMKEWITKFKREVKRRHWL